MACLFTHTDSTDHHLIIFPAGEEHVLLRRYFLL